MESIIGVTDVEYNGSEIIKDQNKNVIIVRIYFKDNSIVGLVPAAIVPYIPEIVLIITALFAVALIGIPIMTSEEEFTKSYVAEDVIGSYYSEDVTGCLQNFLNIDRDDAKDFLTCLDNAQVNNEPTIECYSLLEYDVESPDTKTDILNFLTCMKVTEETKGIIGSDIFDDPTWTDNADANIEDLNTIIDNLENDVITPKEALEDGNETKNKSEDETLAAAEEYADDDCVFDIAGKCILTKKGLDTAILIGAGIAGLYALSTVKNITKK